MESIRNWNINVNQFVHKNGLLISTNVNNKKENRLTCIGRFGKCIDTHCGIDLSSSSFIFALLGK